MEVEGAEEEAEREEQATISSADTLEVDAPEEPLQDGWLRKRRKDAQWHRNSISEGEWKEKEAQRTAEGKEQGDHMQLDGDAVVNEDEEWVDQDEEEKRGARKQLRRASATEANKQRRQRATPNTGQRPPRLHRPQSRPRFSLRD